MSEKKAILVLFCVLTVVFWSICVPRGYCQVGEVALLVQQSPAEGGQIAPSMGVHHFGPGEEVTLTAVARPGFQFVYWLGDVTDTMSNSTAVRMDSPKIIIAVFERSRYDLPFFEPEPQCGAIGGLTGTPGESFGSGGGGGGGEPRQKFHGPREPKPPESDDLPVPEPVPEPATMLLFAAGSAWVLVTGGRKRQR